MANSLNLIAEAGGTWVYYVRCSEPYTMDLLRIDIEMDNEEGDSIYTHLPEYMERRYFKNVLLIEKLDMEPGVLSVNINPNNTSPLYTEAVRCLLGESITARIHDWVKELNARDEDAEIIDECNKSLITNDEAQLILDRIARVI